MIKENADFVLCVANMGCEDLDVWKIYRVLPDAKAVEAGCLRVVDESGEDYLYPTDCFVQVMFLDEIHDRLLMMMAGNLHDSPEPRQTRGEHNLGHTQTP